MSHVETIQEGRVVQATLSNPPHGLMTSAMIRELHDNVERWEDDDSVGAVILTGAHPDRFLAHFDVADILAGARAAPKVPPAAIKATLQAAAGASKARSARNLLEKTPLAGVLEVVEMHNTLLDIERSGVAYVAALNGSALGGGCELSLACDFRLMAKGDFLIGQPELLLGFPPGGGGTQRLARLLGTARAREIALDPAPLSPLEAEKIGLITRAVAPTKLANEAMDMATRLASRSKTGTRATKRAISIGGSQSLEAGLTTEAAEFFGSVTADDAILLMQHYVDAMAEFGDVPVYVEEFREQFIAGTRVRLHD